VIRVVLTLLAEKVGNVITRAGQPKPMLWR
jgi:hypothetical protein